MGTRQKLGATILVQSCKVVAAHKGQWPIRLPTRCALYSILKIDIAQFRTSRLRKLNAPFSVFPATMISQEKEVSSFRCISARLVQNWVKSGERQRARGTHLSLSRWRGHRMPLKPRILVMADSPWSYRRAGCFWDAQEAASWFLHLK